MDFSDLPMPRWNKELLKQDKCIIDGEEQPLFIGKIVKMLNEGSQPRILVLADPGHGKTWAFGKLAEKLHNELDILEGEFNPEEQITMDPVKHSENVRKMRKKIVIVPDADSVYPSSDHNKPKNQNNRNLIYLSRRFSNILGYDAHEMYKCDKGIRTNHNFRLVAMGNADTYKFKVIRVKTQSDAERESEAIDEKPLGVWKPDPPSKETQERIENLDQEEKESQVIEGEDRMKMKRKKEKMKKQAFS